MCWDKINSTHGCCLHIFSQDRAPPRWMLLAHTADFSQCCCQVSQEERRTDSLCFP